MDPEKELKELKEAIRSTFDQILLNFSKNGSRLDKEPMKKNQREEIGYFSLEKWPEINMKVKQLEKNIEKTQKEVEDYQEDLKCFGSLFKNMPATMKNPTGLSEISEKIKTAQARTAMEEFQKQSEFICSDNKKDPVIPDRQASPNPSHSEIISNAGSCLNGKDPENISSPESSCDRNILIDKVQKSQRELDDQPESEGNPDYSSENFRKTQKISIIHQNALIPSQNEEEESTFKNKDGSETVISRVFNESSPFFALKGRANQFSSVVPKEQVANPLEVVSQLELVNNLCLFISNQLGSQGEEEKEKFKELCQACIDAIKKVESATFNYGNSLQSSRNQSLVEHNFARIRANLGLINDKQASGLSSLKNSMVRYHHTPSGSFIGTGMASQAAQTRRGAPSPFPRSKRSKTMVGTDFQGMRPMTIRETFDVVEADEAAEKDQNTEAPARKEKSSEMDGNKPTGSMEGIRNKIDDSLRNDMDERNSEGNNSQTLLVETENALDEFLGHECQFEDILKATNDLGAFVKTTKKVIDEHLKTADLSIIEHFSSQKHRSWSDFDSQAIGYIGARCFYQLFISSREKPAILETIRSLREIFEERNEAEWIYYLKGLFMETAENADFVKDSEKLVAALNEPVAVLGKLLNGGSEQAEKPSAQDKENMRMTREKVEKVERIRVERNEWASISKDLFCNMSILVSACARMLSNASSKIERENGKRLTRTLEVILDSWKSTKRDFSDRKKLKSNLKKLETETRIVFWRNLSSLWLSLGLFC